MTAFVHSTVIICFRFLFVDHLGGTATLENAPKGIVKHVEQNPGSNTH